MIPSAMRVKFDMTHFFCLKCKSAEGEINTWSVLYFSDPTGISYYHVEVVLFLSCLLLHIKNAKYYLKNIYFFRSPYLNSIFKNKINMQYIIPVLPVWLRGNKAHGHIVLYDVPFGMIYLVIWQLCTSTWPVALMAL